MQLLVGLRGGALDTGCRLLAVCWLPGTKMDSSLKSYASKTAPPWRQILPKLYIYIYKQTEAPALTNPHTNKAFCHRTNRCHLPRSRLSPPAAPAAPAAAMLKWSGDYSLPRLRAKLATLQAGTSSSPEANPDGFCSWLVLLVVWGVCFFCWCFVFLFFF